MSSISSLSSSSSSSSIYGNRTYNIISGLASGMDTEELISGLVQSYQQKIQSLEKQNTKLQWQQEAYQSISDKLVEFNRNYASYLYSSGTNLSSSSFFTSAMITTAKGNNADLVTASGKSSSNIVLNAVKQLATAAQYTVGTDNLISSGNTLTGSSELDLSTDVEVSKLAGELTITYGSKEISINFDKQEFFTEDGTSESAFSAKALEDAINDKLKEQSITVGSGSYTADEVIGVSVDENGKISFSDKRNAGNSVYVSGAMGSLGDMITLDEDELTNNKSIQLDVDKLVDSVKPSEYLEGKSITVTLDGVSKSISLPQITSKDGSPDNDQFIKDINTALEKAFGAGKVEASHSNSKLSFSLKDEGNSNLSVESSDSIVGDMLGIGSGLTNYLDMDKTLESLNINFGEGGLTANDDGTYDLVINEVKINSYSKDTTLSTIINDINDNTKVGFDVSYSNLTNSFVFTAEETGEGKTFSIAEGLGTALFGKVGSPGTADESGTSSTLDTAQDSADTSVQGKFDDGKDAIFSVTVNGADPMVLKRSSNTVDLDGMKVTFHETFNEETAVGDISSKDKVTFSTSTDADTIVDAVKKMINDYNTMMSEIKKAYSTTPLQQSDGDRYEPLSDEDMADMSDSAIEKYEEKAKTGLLFMDSDLSSLYNDLRSAVTSLGNDLRAIGIDTAYSNGETTLTLDESAFREALQSDPDKVQDVFTRSKENGASTNGLMASLTVVTDRYAATTGATKGILIEKAGSKYSPSAALSNEMLEKMQDVEEKISKWQDKMSDQVDYYTNKFTQLELLVNQMNSQSSALAGLMGG